MVLNICDVNFSFISNHNEKLTSYSGGTIITGINLDQIFLDVENILSDIQSWFLQNKLKANAGELYLFLSTKSKSRLCF